MARRRPIGTMYGLGVGPGDPELITLKARRLLRACPVIAYPAPTRGESVALGIVASHLPGGQREIPIRMPLDAAQFPAERVYAEAAAEIGVELEAGHDVAVICQGDPFFYGSFMYLFGRVTDRYPVEVVPGVSSLTACATALGAPLAARTDVLTVLPAPLPASEIEARLLAAEAVAIIKVGRHFAKVRALLDRLNLTDSARYIEHATRPDQGILPIGDVNPDSVPYFSMILVHRRGEAWQ